MRLQGNTHFCCAVLLSGKLGVNNFKIHKVYNHKAFMHQLQYSDNLVDPNNGS